MCLTHQCSTEDEPFSFWGTQRQTRCLRTTWNINNCSFTWNVLNTCMLQGGYLLTPWTFHKQQLPKKLDTFRSFWLAQAVVSMLTNVVSRCLCNRIYYRHNVRSPVSSHSVDIFNLMWHKYSCISKLHKWCIFLLNSNVSLNLTM